MSEAKATAAAIVANAGVGGGSLIRQRDCGACRVSWYAPILLGVRRTSSSTRLRPSGASRAARKGVLQAVLKLPISASSCPGRKGF